MSESSAQPQVVLHTDPVEHTQTMTLTDQEIARLVPQQRELFAVLIRRYEKALLRYMQRLGISQVEDRLDILQNTYIKAYRNILSFDTSLSFSTWIYRIAHNESVSFLRIKKIQPVSTLVDDPDVLLAGLHDESLDIAEDTNARINADHVSKALNRLDEKYRTILILRYFEEREYQDISDILQIPAGSVATLIHRAKKQLAKELHFIHT
ncbi:MAG: hypothetical protein RIQ72_539 [Candidatus Parcubacteria bacterium]